MDNKWREIWNNREIGNIDLGSLSEFEAYTELKKMDGFDVSVENSAGYYQKFYDSIIALYEKELKQAASIFEVGCGSGTNLFLFQNRGKKVGGLDYSDTLLETAKAMLPNAELYLMEAKDLPVETKYDIVMSDSVFAYFESREYGEAVLQKMFDKAEKKIILLEIYDKDKEEECISYRRATIPNYDEVYKGLSRTFYPKEMFRSFAEEHNCEVCFEPVENEYYWNSKYMYNCILTIR